MNTKTKKVLSILLDVVLVLLVAAIFFVSINAIVSKDKGYTSVFGVVVYAAKTDSMNGSREDSFKQNALVFSKELKTEAEKKSLEVGTVITFWTFEKNQKILNTHRITRVIDAGGSNCQYITRGDKYTIDDFEEVMWSEVVSVYNSKIEGMGGFVLFAQSSMGFLVVVVLPSVLIFIYCIFAFYTSAKKVMADKKAEEAAALSEQTLVSQKEQLRKEILAELQQKEQLLSKNSAEAEAKAETEKGK